MVKKNYDKENNKEFNNIWDKLDNIEDSGTYRSGVLTFIGICLFVGVVALLCIDDNLSNNELIPVENNYLIEGYVEDVRGDKIYVDGRKFNFCESQADEVRINDKIRIYGEEDGWNCADFSIISEDDNMEELGNSICLEEYNKEFDKYEDGTLYCKDKEQVESYDGIKVNIGGQLK